MAGVEINDMFVRRTLDNGRVEEVLWRELCEVRVITTADGPFAEAMFFVLIGTKGNGCVVPYSAANPALLPRLRALPDFDDRRVTQALASTSDCQFSVWRRTPWRTVSGPDRCIRDARR
ncbi:hypothetical protein KO481_09270 [Nocardia sp. NEAU-G5]|uniref:Uncharacterized protein n=1 Tax=Nocardia albiluteola TaxID=2842303 RepID=A0ABS6AUL1_9NOCA|nr:hypothetical protein [Nocardia albiluteola]MBU3061712.1 hypothetical protein [Nocardia albiluteola]